MAASATVDAGQDRLEYTASGGERNLLTVTGSLHPASGPSRLRRVPLH
jgi:hypothetical protein